MVRVIYILLIIYSLKLSAQKTSGFSKDVVGHSAIRTMNTSFGPLTETATANIRIHRGFLPLIMNGYEIDSDGDGVVDAYDECPSTPEGAVVDNKGCKVFVLEQDTFVVETLSNSCIGQTDGVISVKALNLNFNYRVEFTGSSTTLVLDSTTNYQGQFDNLATGTYSLCISVVEFPEYRQCYEVKVEEPETLEVEAIKDLSRGVISLNLWGDGPYQINLNNTEIETTKNRIELPLEPGLNRLGVSTDLDCQGNYFEEIFVSEKVIVYPNPTTGPIQLYLGGLDQNVQLRVRNLQGQLLYNQSLIIPNNRVIEYDLSLYPPGVYLLEITGETLSNQVKVIKN